MFFQYNAMYFLNVPPEGPLNFSYKQPFNLKNENKILKTLGELEKKWLTYLN